LPAFGSHIKESSMQQYSTHRSTSTTLLILAAIGTGAAIAYALASPRRRAALVVAGQSALDAGSRALTTSAERLREMLPEPRHERASELMHEAVTRARRLPADARDEARTRWQALRESADERLNGGLPVAASAGGLLAAAAAVGAGLYALQRYGGSERLRQKLGADENGNITLEKTLLIQAPIEHVFDTWSRYENFPRFMSNVKRVRPLGGDRSRWTVRGPAGIGVEFESVAHMQRPTELAWDSELGSTVHNSGRVTLVPEGTATRATVRLSYRPPAGAMGQAVSSLLGADPRQEFEDDLNRMKQYIEGRRPIASQPSMATGGIESTQP
jgi:uncharacterized membrane protein